MNNEQLTVPKLSLGETCYAKINVTEEKILGQIRATGKKQSIANIEDLFKYSLYYYPFYLMRANGMLSRKILNDLNKTALISVDGIKGYFALAHALPGKNSLDDGINSKAGKKAVLLKPVLEPPEAWERGVSSLRRVSALSMIFWKNHRLLISPLECRLIYKPYWLVEITSPKGGEYTRVIDATSGEVGGQNAYRFLKGLEEYNKRSGINNV